MAQSGGPGRPASDVRFKEIAHYVGLSLVRNPNSTRNTAGANSRSLRSASSVDYSEGERLMLPASPSMEPPSDHFPEGALPAAHSYGKSERLNRELEWLRSEQRTQNEHLKKLENCLSDSVLVEKKAKQRITKQQEVFHKHSQRAADMDKRIGLVRDQLAAAEGAPRREKSAAGLQTPQQGSPPGSREGGSASQPRLGLLAQSASRAAAASQSGMSSSPSSPLAGRSMERSLDQLKSNPSRDTLYSSSEHWPSTDDPKAPAIVTDCGSSAKPPNTGSTTIPPTPPCRRRARALSESSVQPSQQQLSSDEEDQLNEARRVRVRQEMKEKAGGARQAFKKIDLNGSGSISSQEFADGITRLGVDWQQLTGLKRPRELFGLFDPKRKFSISFVDLFPEDAGSSSARPSTPEFYRAYVRVAKKHAESEKINCPSWSPTGTEDRLHTSHAQATQQNDAVEKRKWIQSTMRRLKTRGKSDARCREVVALHLPRGTGPKDVEGVSTFSKIDLKNCKRVYSEETNGSMRRMWKVVGEFKDQRKEQKRVFDQLYGVTEAAAARQRAEETISELKGGLGLGFAGKGNGDDDGRPVHSAGSARAGSLGGPPGVGRNQDLFAHLAEECDTTEEDVQDLYKDFVKFADTGEMMGKRGFTRLLQSLLSHRTVEESETDAWWAQITAEDSGRPGSSGHEDSGAAMAVATSRKAQCNFEQFCLWWAESEAMSLE